eukprot:370827_1
MSNSAVIPTVLLTGAASGIGRGIAIHLAKQNKYKFALLDIDKHGLIKTKSLCIQQDSSANIKLVECDVTNTSLVKSNIDEIGNNFGPLSVVINNAGIIHKHLIDANIDIKKVQQLISVNLMAPIFICSYTVPYLKQTKLKYSELNCISIINITSACSTMRGTASEFGIYCASKFGLRGFTDCLFDELRDSGIKVCNLAPAWTNTPIMNNHNVVEKNKNNLDNIVIGEQALQTDDIGQTVNFILNTSITCVPREIHLWPQYNEYKENQLFLKSKQSQNKIKNSKL